MLAALLVSRGVLPLLCTAAFPAARADGLGQAVAASVSRGAAVVSLACVVVVAAVGAAGLAELASAGLAQQAVPTTTSTTAGSPSPGRGTTAGRSRTRSAGRSAWPSAATVLLGGRVAVGAAVLLARRCVRRFGGVTGDVYGACVELAFTTMLVVPALLLP